MHRTEMHGTRRFYEARVLVVPQGRSALGVQTAMRRLGLDGVMTVVDVAGGGVERRPLAGYGWSPPTTAGRAADAVEGADMVVLLAADLSEVREHVCREVAAAARNRGCLLAALLVGPGGDDAPVRDTAMVVLRAEVDMLVTVRGPELAAPFLDVLRGGFREPAGGEPAGALDTPAGPAEPAVVSVP